MNCCVLIAGLPASGKTTFADRLARELGLPMVSKDRVKELMYESICCKGWMSNPLLKQRRRANSQQNEAVSRGGVIYANYRRRSRLFAFVGYRNGSGVPLVKVKPPLPPTTPEGGAWKA